jgi:hypothetical protein
MVCELVTILGVNGFARHEVKIKVREFDAYILLLRALEVHLDPRLNAIPKGHVPSGRDLLSFSCPHESCSLVRTTKGCLARVNGQKLRVRLSQGLPARRRRAVDDAAHPVLASASDGLDSSTSDEGSGHKDSTGAAVNRPLTSENGELQQLSPSFVSDRWNLNRPCVPT